MEVKRVPKIDYTCDILVCTDMVSEILSVLAEYRKIIDETLAEDPKWKVVYHGFPESAVDDLTIEDWLDSKITLPKLPSHVKLTVLYSFGRWFLRNEKNEDAEKLFEIQWVQFEDDGLFDSDGNIILSPHEAPRFDSNSYKSAWMNFVNIVMFGYIGWSITVRRMETIVKQGEDELRDRDESDSIDY